jgi:hypothetical protein
MRNAFSRNTQGDQKMMRKFAVALLASAALSLPAIAASSDQQPQQQQMQQPSHVAQAQNTNRTQSQLKSTNQAGQNQPSAILPGTNQTAQNQPNKTISPRSLSGDKIRQVQQALDKDGFSVGRVDGRWGRKTTDAIKQFQQSKNMQANGKLNQQTLSDLGLNGANFAQGNNAQQQR